MDEPLLQLFSYGTLRYREVQLATFGRELAGTPDAVSGFIISTIEITDPDVVATSGENRHLALRRTGDPADQVEGVIFQVTPAELAAADEYETDDYARVEVRSRNGVDTYVYILAADA